MSSRGFRDFPLPARAMIVLVAALGTASATVACVLEPPELRASTVVLVMLTAVSGVVRFPLPVRGSLTLSFTFILATRVGAGLGASTIAGMLAALAPGLLAADRRRLGLSQNVFNLASSAVATTVAGVVYLNLGGRVADVSWPDAVVPFVGYTVVFAVLNLGLISLVVKLSGGASVGRSLLANLSWSVPSYVAGGALAALVAVLMMQHGAPLFLLGAPFFYLLYLSYRARTDKLEEEQRHTKQLGELYHSITEVLAVAIEAKDGNTQEHLIRVREYSLGVGEALGLAPSEMEALRVAALLHDVGKVAVPDYILTKPGRLTPEEMAKMRVHPVVGCEIIQGLPFPFEVAPLVRHHHEQWDGGGYPDGLKGERIPLGSRILTAVDCFDALTSDRPYRKKLSPADALEFLQENAGRMFDPAIVTVLRSLAPRLEERVQRADRRVTAGLAEAISATQKDEVKRHPAAAARPILEALGREIEAACRSHDVDAIVAGLSKTLAQAIPHRTVAIWKIGAGDDRVVASWVHGQAAEKIRGLAVPLGERQAGWVALHQRPYAGKRHHSEIDRDGSRFDLEDIANLPGVESIACSVLAPLSDDQGLFGVIALYHEHGFTYRSDHLDALCDVAHPILRVLRRQSVA